MSTSLWALAAASALAGSGPCEATILPPRPDISEAAQRRRELYGPVVIAAACRHGIPPLLLDALVTQESRYDPTRVSPKGAMGLGQLMPGTARELGVANPFDPAQNANGSARYLATLFDEFGTPKLALAAYNAGPRRVRDAGGVPPFAETIGYVATVEGGWRRAEATRSVPASLQGAPWTPRSVGKILTDAFGGVVTDTWRPMNASYGAEKSFHKYNQAVDFVPGGGVMSINRTEIRAVMAQHGIEVVELLGPGDPEHDDHWHVAFRISSSEPAATLAVRQEEIPAEEPEPPQWDVFGRFRWEKTQAQKEEKAYEDAQ